MPMVTELQSYVYGTLTQAINSAVKQILLTGRAKVTYTDSGGNPSVQSYINGERFYNGSCGYRNVGDVYSLYSRTLFGISHMSNALKNTHCNPRVQATLSTPYSLDPVDRDLILNIQDPNNGGYAAICRKGADIPSGEYYINWTLLADEDN